MTLFTTQTQLGEKHTKADSPTIPSVVAMVFSHLLSFNRVMQLQARLKCLENMKTGEMESGPSTIHVRAMFSSTPLFILYIYGLSKSGLEKMKSMKRKVIIFTQRLLGSCSRHLFFSGENTSYPPP